MSIKPKFVAPILAQKKKWEYRKLFPIELSPSENREVIIYASRPLQQIVGKFTIGAILVEKDYDILWDQTKENAGIPYQDYKDYFQASHTGNCFALQITDLCEFTHKFRPNSNPLFKPPQTHVKITNTIAKYYINTGMGVA